MILHIAYFLIFGKPLIFYTGIITILCFLFTALIGYLNLHGNHTIPFRIHPWMALTSLILGLLHALFGLSIYFKLI